MIRPLQRELQRGAGRDGGERDRAAGGAGRGGRRLRPQVGRRPHHRRPAPRQDRHTARGRARHGLVQGIPGKPTFLPNSGSQTFLQFISNFYVFSLFLTYSSG